MVDYYDPYAKESYETHPTTPLAPFAPQNSSKRTWLAHTFCYASHAGLIFVHVVFLLLWFTGLAHKVVIPIGPKSNIIATGIVQATTIIATLYIAGLLFISQQLATRRNLYSNQTLTATHDNLSSWTGLGASLVSVWRQRATAAAVSSSLIVAAYFLCLTILHITSPALVTVQAFNSTEHSVIATTLGPPNISVANLGSGHQTSFWLDATPVIPYLSHSDRISKVGLENGTLYDVLSDNNGEGHVVVSATTFNVTCGYVEGAQVTANGDNGTWNITTVYGTSFADPIPVLAPNTFKRSSFYSYNLKDPFRHALFYTSADILDSSGSSGVPIQLDPPMRPGAHMDASRQASVSDKNSVTTLQVIGCSVSLVNQSALVDAHTHLLQDLKPSGRKTTSSWSVWQPDTVSPNATDTPARNERRQVASPQNGSSTYDALTIIPMSTTSISQEEPFSSHSPYHHVPQDSTSSDPTPDPSLSHPVPQDPTTTEHPVPQTTTDHPVPQTTTEHPVPQTTPVSQITPVPQTTIEHPVPQTTTEHPVPQDSSTSASTPSSSPPEFTNGRVLSTAISVSQISATSTVPDRSVSQDHTASTSITTRSVVTSTISESEGTTAEHPVPTGPPDDSNPLSTNSQFGVITYYEMDDVFLDVWWDLFDQAAVSRFPSTDDCPGMPWENPTGCNPLSVVEQYVMEDLSLYPTLLDSPDRPVPKVTLHDLENTLASATAASYWSALYAKAGGLKESDPYNVANDNNYRVAAMAGTASISYPYAATRLNVNLTPVLCGLAASIVLCILMYIIVGKPLPGNSEIDTVGVLQILWLIRTRPDLQSIVSDVDEPTVDNLRKSGMVRTTMSPGNDDPHLGLLSYMQ